MESCIEKDKIIRFFRAVQNLLALSLSHEEGSNSPTSDM
jgi:hypothetical protein